MNNSLLRVMRVLVFSCLILLLLRGARANAAKAPIRSAAEAARELAMAGRVHFRVSGQARTLVLAADEVAVPLRGEQRVALPAGAEMTTQDSLHQFLRLPAGVTAADWFAANPATTAANGAAVPGTGRQPERKLAPVFYEQGREGAPAARHVATTKLLLVGLGREAASAAAAATGATDVAPLIGDNLWVLEYNSAYEMMGAAGALQREGLNVEPQLTHALTKRAAPNDPLYNQQFYFKNTGQNGGTPGEDLNIESLWPTASGAGVTVAVVDDGLELTHPDLSPNVATEASLHANVLDANNDPTPPAAANHGTICAGFIAARGNNAIGITGAAPQARLIGVRLLGEGKNGDAATDVQETAALGWRPEVVQISSDSWGPNDDAKTVSAPESGALAALRAATTTGRSGRGVVYFFAAGNGRDAGDYAGYDGYSGSRYVLAIGATDNRGKQASFSESGPQLIACAAGQVNDASAEQLIATDNVGPRGANTAASPGGDYTASGVQGTSYSTPQAAGVAALMLQANPNLGWRDVKEIIIRTARKNDPADSDWKTNRAGFSFSHKYGAGYVDAAAAVALARTWTNLAAELTATQSSTTSSAIPDNDSAGTSRSFTFANSPNLRVETVEVTVSVTHPNRGQVGYVLTSPSGMTTVLGETRAADTSADLTDFTFSTPRYWGESSNGAWTVKVLDLVTGTTGTLNKVSVSLYGEAAPAVALPVFSAEPVAVTVATGSTAVFSAAANNSPSYQWQRNGVNVPAATTGVNSATLVVSAATAAQGGTYTLVATNGAGSIPSNPATLTVATTSEIPRLTNLSTLTDITDTVSSFTLGTVVTGSGTKPLVIRAVGPSLGELGVPNTIGDPKVELLAGQTVVAANDNWQTPAYSGAPNANEVLAAMAGVGAFPLTSKSGLDGAIYGAALPARDYTVRVSGVNNSTGSVIAEIYDATPGGTFTSSTPRLINVSVLKQVNAGGLITLGFNVGPPGGTIAKTIIIRAIGPGLTGLGVPGVMADPQLTLYRIPSQAVIATNDNWGGDPALRAVMQGVTPGFIITDVSSKDAMLLVTLPPGGYTAEARGVGNSGGFVIIEAYEVP